MKIVISGGTGFLGQLLINSFLSDSEKHELVVLSRGGRSKMNDSSIRLVPWNAHTLGEWAREIDGADVVINMTGKSVKCFYTDKILKILRDSRVLSTEVMGQAIKQAQKPPPLWIQMSTSAIYAHTFDAPNDEENGRIGEDPEIPIVWKRISELAQDWEKALYSFPTDKTRKVLIRCGVVMGLQKGSAFDIFLKLSRWGLGGTVASGKQMISWIHESDFVNSMRFLLKNESITGPVNLCAPHPISQEEFMKTLRDTVGMRFGLPVTKWMVELSSYVTRIDSELSLKSRYAIPKVLLDNQFNFQFPYWKDAAKDLFYRCMQIKESKTNTKTKSSDNDK